MARASESTKQRALEILKAVAVAQPRAFKMCHANENQHPEAYDYVILATRELTRFDPLFGMNGKRGSSTDPSSDAFFYGTTNESSSVIDFLVAAGDNNTLEEIKWQDVSASGPGKWLDPSKFKTFAEKNGEIPVDDCPQKLAIALAKIRQLEQAQGNTVPKVAYEEHGGDAVWDTFGNVILSDYQRAGRVLDAQSFRWAGRTMHDDYMEGLTLEQSINKHRAEWCAALGIPVS